MEKRKIFNPITIAKETVELSSRDKLVELVENHKLTFDNFICDIIGDLYILHLDWNNKYYFDRKLVEDYFHVVIPKRVEEKEIIAEDDFEDAEPAPIEVEDNTLIDRETEYCVHFSIDVVSNKSPKKIYTVNFVDICDSNKEFMKKIAKAISGYSGD